MTMPELINRRVTDLLFGSEPSGAGHLRRVGIEEDRIPLVGDVMIDTRQADQERSYGDGHRYIHR
jgi:UDP-N-acetylglucosamine 2-epimerase